MLGGGTGSFDGPGDFRSSGCGNCLRRPVMAAVMCAVSFVVRAAVTTAAILTSVTVPVSIAGTDVLQFLQVLGCDSGAGIGCSDGRGS